MAARLLDGAAHGGEIAVEDENDVIGETRLGEAREGPEVGEEDGDLALAALQVARPRIAIAGMGEGREERRHPEIAGGTQLTGEAHAGHRLDAAEDTRLLGA